MARFKAIGVLGGIGPVATAHFYSTLLSIAQQKYGCVQGADFPHIIIDSLPFKGSSETGINDKSTVLTQLKKSIHLLSNTGAEVIVIPCNSVHIYINEIRKYSKIPVLSIVEEVTQNVKADDIKSVVVLSSESSFKENLYRPLLEEIGVMSINNSQDMNEITTALILDVMAGRFDSNNKQKLLKKLESYKSDGIDATILGCTELPVVIKQSDTPMKLYDSLQILANSTLVYAQKS